MSPITPPTVAVVMAMRAEAAGVLQQLGARSVDGPVPLTFEWFEADRDGIRVIVAVNGVDPRTGVDSIGTEAAALNTHEVISRFAPSLVISAGTAGAWTRSGGRVGDLYVSWPHVVHHDRRIDLDGMREYGIGSHPVWDGAPALADALGARLGIVTTGNSLDESDTDREMILSLSGEVKEMEAAAVAQVCALHGVAFVAVKAITDLVDDPAPTSEQFLDNLASASTRLAEAVPATVDHLAHVNAL
ncbi:MAG: hypothetical protein VW708_07740 [Ilumatobacter sp.]